MIVRFLMHPMVQFVAFSFSLAYLVFYLKSLLLISLDIGLDNNIACFDI